MSTTAKLTPAAEADLCEECPLLGDVAGLGIADRVTPGGWPTVRETPRGVALTWDSGDELELERWQVRHVLEALEEYGRRWG